MHRFPTNRAKISSFISRITDPFINLAVEDCLLSNPDYGSHILFIYRNRPSVILGRNQNPWKETDIKLLHRKNIQLVRRKSGGGTVFHDLGNTNYSITTPRSTFLRSATATLLNSSLLPYIPSTISPRYDILLHSRKISGSAYKLIGDRAYHHGTMLIDTDLSVLGDALRPKNRDRVQGKGVDSVRSEVTRIRDWNLEFDQELWIASLVKEFCTRFGNTSDVVVPYEITNETYNSDPHIQKIHTELKSHEWIFNQTPSFTHTLHHQFSWGTINMIIHTKSAIITQITLADSSISPYDQGEWVNLLCDSLIGVEYDSQQMFEKIRRFDNDDEQVNEFIHWLINEF